MGWKPEVKAGNDREWTGNALVFATKEEAEGYARDLGGRWLSVTDTRAIAVDEPVNYTWNGEQQPPLQPIKK